MPLLASQRQGSSPWARRRLSPAPRRPARAGLAAQVASKREGCKSKGPGSPWPRQSGLCGLKVARITEFLKMPAFAPLRRRPPPRAPPRSSAGARGRASHPGSTLCSSVTSAVAKRASRRALVQLRISSGGLALSAARSAPAAQRLASSRILATSLCVSLEGYRSLLFIVLPMQLSISCGPDH